LIFIVSCVLLICIAVNDAVNENTNRPLNHALEEAVSTTAQKVFSAGSEGFKSLGVGKNHVPSTTSSKKSTTTCIPPAKINRPSNGISFAF